MKSKSEVDFEHPAKGTHHCSQCLHYIKWAEKCHIISGHIEGRDWCKLFERSRARSLYKESQ